MLRYRSVAVCVLLTFVTCGLYGIYWFISLTDEVGEVTGDRTPTGGIALLFTLLTCGLYKIYWAFRMGQKLDESRYRYGVPSGSFPVVFLLLSVFAMDIIVWAIIQGELNRYSPDMGD